MLTVILLAAGSGERAGFAHNKILHEWNGMPVLSYSLSAFAPYADEMLIACRKEDESAIKAILAPYPNAKTVRGGITRMESVYLALQSATSDMVLIHDAARPFVTQKIIEDCIESVHQYGSGIAAIPVTDTVAHAPDGYITDSPSRTDLYALQTPQGFRTEEILPAYTRGMQDGRLFTDDSGVYAAYCGAPRIIPGDTANKKLTHPADFAPAERVGFGVDTHAFAPLCHSEPQASESPDTESIILGGVRIPSHAPLIAHSDGDVLIHALMDALLSAIGERDIGYHFPDTDPAYKGADSMQLLAHVMDMVRGKLFSVVNVSISVLAETPRLSPHIEAMRQNLRTALSCENVAIAAGTNEKLGYIGEGKGITVYATVLLR